MYIVNENIARLIFEMEYIIGSECYNPNSYDGYTGEEGCSFRYPVLIFDEESHGLARYKCKIYDGKAKYIDTMKYVFGSNHLFIGNGLLNVLSMLERRYGLDFNKLEEQRLKGE